MDVQLAGADDCSSLEAEAVVVIDVLRAFTTAAYAFAAGVRDIVLVASVERAMELRERFPGSILLGERDGHPIEGFDFGNSPAEMAGRDLEGRRLIHRTTTGTRAAVECRRASTLMVSSMVCAQATASYLAHLAPRDAALVAAGRRGGRGGEEDFACAEYLAALLRGEPGDRAATVEQVRSSPAGQRFLDPARPHFPPGDLDLALEVDRFDFAMRAREHQDLLVLEKVTA